MPLIIRSGGIKIHSAFWSVSFSQGYLLICQLQLAYMPACSMASWPCHFHKRVGTLKILTLSSVTKTLTMQGQIFWSINATAIIFGIHDPSGTRHFKWYHNMTFTHFNQGQIFLNIDQRTFLFHMHGLCDKSFPLLQYHDFHLDLRPNSR